jgi:RimJ/RimL family protein N-acetyltransferase
MTVRRIGKGMSNPSIWRPTLTGRLVHLRPLGEDDWAPLREVASDPAIWAGHPVPDRWKEPIFRSFFEGVLAKEGAMAVFDRGSDELIGSSTFHSHRPERSQIEIGSTFLARSHWGGSYNREMKALMLTHAFQHVERVVFRIGETNHRSRRACEKIGGRLTDRTEVVAGPNGPVLHLVYALTRKEFESANEKADGDHPRT